MKKFTNVSERPVSGVGKVSVGRKSFTIELTYKDKKDKEQTEELTFALDELPEAIPDEFELVTGKSYFAVVSNSLDKLLQIRPAKGAFTVVCSGIAKTKDGDDFFVQASTGQYGPYSSFVANLVVAKGPAKGIIYPLYMPLTSGDRMRFVPDSDGLIAITGDPTKSKAIEKLYKWAELSGIDSDEIELEFPTDDDEPSDDPQDVLRVLDKAVRKLKREFDIFVDAGYVSAMGDSDDEPEPADPDEAEKPKRKTEPAEETETEEKPKKKKPSFDD